MSEEPPFAPAGSTPEEYQYTPAGLPQEAAGPATDAEPVKYYMGPDGPVPAPPEPEYVEAVTPEWARVKPDDYRVSPDDPAYADVPRPIGSPRRTPAGEQAPPAPAQAEEQAPGMDEDAVAAARALIEDLWRTSQAARTASPGNAGESPTQPAPAPEPAPKAAPQPIPAPERPDHTPLIEKVVQAGRGTAVIETDLPADTDRAYPDGPRSGEHGFRTFGDGSSRYAQRPAYFTDRGKAYYDDGNNGRTLPADRLAEAVGFVPAGNGPEADVYFDYNFDPANAGREEREALKLPDYPDASDRRSGNHLTTRIRLPRDVALELQAAIEADPNVARETVHKIVVELGGIAEAAWSGRATPNQFNPICPPYNDIPADSAHRITMLTPLTDQHGQALRATKLDFALAA